MSYLYIFVYVFIILVCIYILYNKLQFIDVTLLLTASLVLLIICISKSKNIENFTDTPIALDEDVSSIYENPVVYLSTYNSNSFNNMSKTWTNIAPAAVSKDPFTFEVNPVFTARTGLYLGNNKITGPMCNNLGIQFHNTYTIVLVCKHGSLVINDTNSEIEILKLYANSPNNNALTLSIQNGSISNVNDVQVGNLVFKYVNNSPYTCKVKPTDEYISLNKEILTFYFIVKDTDNIKVLTMDETSSSMRQILTFTVNNSDTTFSNKELTINRMQNWNANIFNLAIYNKALSPDKISTYYSNIMTQYYKHIDPSFVDAMNKYNEILQRIQKLTQCPFSKSVCDACSGITNWSDPSQLLNSSAPCKGAINTFCSANQTHSMCKCWDTSSSMYNTDTCRLYRSIFSNEKSSLYDGMSSDDIEYIKKKFGLINPQECPAPIKKPEIITNTYPDYDWNKLKVETDKGKVRSIYPDEPIKKVSTDGVALVNYIQNDPNLNKDMAALPNKIMTQATSDRKNKLSVKKNDLPPPDTFFSKFMNVLIPS